MLHPLRRRRAVGRLRRVGGGAPAAFLFVCHGNICRSPYAEVAFRELTARAWGVPAQVGSAGFIGPGRPAPETARVVAGRRGVDLRAHRSRLLDATMVGDADLIVVMNGMQRREIRRRYGVADGRVLVLGDLDSHRREGREIRDPLDGSAGLFERVYGRIDRCLAALAAAVPPALEDRRA